MIWDLVLRLTGQLRSIPGADRLMVSGIDMSAALALAAALGIPARLAAEFLPDVEAAMVAAINSAGEGAEISQEEGSDV